jgi:hypothetical protein
MLISPGDPSGFSTTELRSHSPKRAGRLGFGRVKDGLTIGPLRATSGPPGGMRHAESAGLNGSQQKPVSLLDLPAGGEELVERLRASARSTNPLTAAISDHRAGAQSGTLSMEALQSRQIQTQHRFQALDRQSRFLQTSRHPSRQNGGFAFTPPSGNLSLLG